MKDDKLTVFNAEESAQEKITLPWVLEEGRKKIYMAQCPETKQYFLIETSLEKNGPAVTNFIDLTDELKTRFQGGAKWPSLTASPLLRSCRWCGSKEVGGCKCQRKQGKCLPKGSYSYQCLFCDLLQPVILGNKMGDIRNLRIVVTSSGFDNIKPLLENIGLKTKDYSQCGFDCDILFVNCGTHDSIDPKKLAAFVRQGGCLYISDLAVSLLVEAFPGSVEFDNNTTTGKHPAIIMDQELSQITGKMIDVNFDLGRWAKIHRHKGKCLIRGAEFGMSNPLMISFNEGKGQVFYTSFHNYKQASQQEQAVLKCMLLRQISETVNEPISTISEALGLNISDLRLQAQR